MNVESSGHRYQDDAILERRITALNKAFAMKLLADWLPIIAFFVVFKVVGGTEGIYPATATAIAIAFLTVGYTWLRHRRVERQQLVMLAVLGVLGGLTLALHDERFIKWKPTVVSWIMALAFLGSLWIGEKPLVERLRSPRQADDCVPPARPRCP